MKLYDFTIAPNPRRVRIFLAEKGIDIPTVQVNLAEGEQFSEQFSGKSILNDVPVLELDNGHCISQVNAICRYIEAVYPDNPLFGATPEEIGTIEMWDHIAFMNGIGAVADAFRNSAEMFEGRALVGKHGYAQIPALSERGMQRTQNFFSDMNDRLSESEFVAGDSYSAADITTLVAVDFAQWVELGIQDDQTHLKRWYDQVSQRPSAQA